jgi:hypothetical protein
VTNNNNNNSGLSFIRTQLLGETREQENHLLGLVGIREAKP